MKSGFHTANRGNILFLILLAVVLFAALAYAVTSSMRGGGKSASSETLKLQVAELQQYFTSLSVTVERMIMMGVPEEKIDFYTTSSTIPQDNTLCTDDSCLVYAANGGGMSYQTFKKLGASALEWSVRMVSVVGIGTALPDMVAVVSAGTDICRYINESEGVVFPGLRDYTGKVNYRWEGDVRPGLVATNARTLGDDAMEETFKGKRMFCISSDGVLQEFHFVLRER